LSSCMATAAAAAACTTVRNGLHKHLLVRVTLVVEENVNPHSILNVDRRWLCSKFQHVCAG
jgi:hypothetical protein